MEPTYAGLRQRLLAFVFDYILIGAYLVVLVAAGFTVNRTLPSLAQALFGSPFSGEASGFLLITLPVALYYALLEASSWQASWGKRRMRLRVCGDNGTRLRTARALSRTALKFIPWELAHACIWQLTFAANKSSPLFLAGFSLVWLLVGANVLSLLLSPTRQTIYDRLTGTFVATAG